MTAGQITLHIIDPQAISEEVAISCLTEADKARAARFRFPDHASHWIACRAGLRQILGKALSCPPREVSLILSEFGKPGLASPHDWLHFNLSHCASLAIVTLGIDGPVGVDLEPLDRASDLLGCETTFCHPEEIAALPSPEKQRASHLLRIWTAKEAVLKALGSGLLHPPEQIRIVFEGKSGRTESDKPIVGIEKQRLHFLEHAKLIGYQVVVSAPESVSRIEII
jgi:4'-phosphopantetheinyl transferase